MPEITMHGGWHPSVLESDIVIDAQGRKTAGVVARFRKHEILDVAKSRTADKHIYREVVICERKVKGEADIDTERLRSHNYEGLIARFPDAWSEFEGEKLEVTGTPLSKLELSPEKAMALWCEGIRSVEDMAATPDAVCERLGFGSKALRDKAAAFLKSLNAQEPKRRARAPRAKSMTLIEGST